MGDFFNTIGQQRTSPVHRINFASAELHCRDEERLEKCQQGAPGAVQRDAISS
jgi:hypothetical protein